VTERTTILDARQRPLRNLRISVTDRCNLRCGYCMPERDYVWLPRQDLLHFEEIATLAAIFTTLGVDRVRLTGGEPLLRRDLAALVQLLAAQPALRDLSLTTNGLLLAEQARALRDAGLHRVSVSLDTLRPERFEALTRRPGLERVLEGIAAARQAGFEGTKLDAVVVRGVNDDELADLLEFGRRESIEVRFIEYMDVGGATGWSMAQVVPRAEILSRLAARYGRIEPVGARDSAPAERFQLLDGTLFGIIGSTTAPFCGACDRARLTADGQWLLCLYAQHGLDLRGPLRSGMPHAKIAELLQHTWERRLDRGAEERFAARERGALVSRDRLLQDPHLEMHTRGG
jgi:cyclic pyranopterin phosphate synthase